MRLDGVKELRPKIRCREISRSDIDAVADLLTRGFVGRSRDYWMQGLRRQAEREVPQGYPRFGYMLDNEGAPAGVLLLLYSRRLSCGETSIHCNLSSWCVEPALRNYAPMLTKIAQRHREVTYFNISPAIWTWPIIEAQGFRRYCDGLFFSLPALSHAASGMTVEIVPRLGNRRRRALDPARGLWLPQPGLPQGHRRRCSLHPAADADSPRLDCRSRDAADLLPGDVGIYRLRRRDRPISASARQDFGGPRFQWTRSWPRRDLHGSARP
jgi:hypothetical protein